MDSDSDNVYSCHESRGLSENSDVYGVHFANDGFIIHQRSTTNESFMFLILNFNGI